MERIHRCASLLLCFVVSACASHGDLAEDKPRLVPPRSYSTAAIACAEPRPGICTMIYQPVCAENSRRERFTVANACQACVKEGVVSYRQGVCPRPDGL